MSQCRKTNTAMSTRKTDGYMAMLCLNLRKGVMDTHETELRLKNKIGSISFGVYLMRQVTKRNVCRGCLCSVRKLHIKHSLADRHRKRHVFLIFNNRSLGVVT